MKNNRILPVLLFPLVISLSGCNGQAKTEATFDPNEVKEVPFVIDSSRLYGVTDLSYQEYYWPQEGKKISYEQSHNLFKILGAKSARFWAHFNYCMSDPTTFIPHQFRVLRACYDDLVTRNPGIQVIGMNHTNFHAEYAGETNANTASSKPPRDLTPGSRYMRWLADYEQSWFTLVKAFPEIEYWEIDNETNNDDFMYRIGGGTFTTLEKAQITYDMMYYGSRGIHRANINAKTVMGGLVTYDDRYPVDFLNDLYDCIYNGDAWDSKDPKDYFQIACWHPYFGNFTKSAWKARNDLLYNVIKTREGKDKKVFCTEAGFNDFYGGNISYQDNVASYITQMYEAAREQGYIETIHYYKMYDNENSSYNRYGLFTDPAYVRNLSSYLDANLKVAPSLASPKPGAYAYQTAAGGTGDLFAYSKFIRY